MANIFVSHSKDDIALARNFGIELVKAGHTERGDVRNRPLDRWDDFLLQELVESDYAVFLLTRNSSESEWISREAWAARALDRAVGKPRPLPIVFVDGQVPELLSSFYTIEATEPS